MDTLQERDTMRTNFKNNNKVLQNLKENINQDVQQGAAFHRQAIRKEVTFLSLLVTDNRIEIISEATSVFSVLTRCGRSFQFLNRKTTEISLIWTNSNRLTALVDKQDGVYVCVCVCVKIIYPNQQLKVRVI